MGAEQSTPAAVDDDDVPQQAEAAAQKARPLFGVYSKPTIVTVERGPLVTPAPPPQSHRPQSSTSDSSDSSTATAAALTSGWALCADGGLVRQRVDSLNEASRVDEWQRTLTHTVASVTAYTIVDALIDAAMTSSAVTAALRQAAEDQRALQATVEELQSKEEAMVEQMGTLIQKNAQLRMECKISEQARISAEKEHERLTGRVEELGESMLWDGDDDEAATSKPPVQRPGPAGAASRIIAGRRSSSGKVSPTPPAPAAARPRSPLPQPPPASKPSTSTPDADAAETAIPRRTSSMRAIFSRRSRSSRMQEG